MATLDFIKPAYYDIEYYSNDNFNDSIIITDEDGNAVDLSSKSLSMQVKESKTDHSSKSLVTLTSSSGITVSGASNNILTFSGTYDISEGSYYYDLENTTDNETIIYGKFIVTGDVTR